LIKTPGESDFDQRRSAIEVQTKQAISLKNNLQFVILPVSFLEQVNVAKAIERWRCFPITYNSAVGGIPREYSGKIQDKLAELLNMGKFL
jgi:hypothetical protein